MSAGGFVPKAPRAFNVVAADRRTWGGIKFDSELEMRIAQALCCVLPEECRIYRQYTFSVLPKQTEVDAKGKTRVVYKERKYVADFVIQPTHGRSTKSDILVVDAKGIEPPDFSLKSALYHYWYKRHIYLVKSTKQLLAVPWSFIGIAVDVAALVSPEKIRTQASENEQQLASRLVRHTP